MELRLHTVASYFPVLRWLIIPFISLVIIHFFILHRLPFQQGYSFPWLTFLIVTGMGLVICEANVRINRWLTGRWSDDHSFGFRVTQQLAFGWLGTSLVFSALYFTVNVGLFGVEFDLVRFLGLLVLLLGISTMETALFMVHEYHRLFRRHEGTEQSLPGQRSESPDYLLVRSGQRLLRIECEEIAFFHSSAGIVTLLTQDGQKWITDFPSSRWSKNRWEMHRTSFVSTGSIWCRSTPCARSRSTATASCSSIWNPVCTMATASLPS